MHSTVLLVAAAAGLLCGLSAQAPTPQIPLQFDPANPAPTGRLVPPVAVPEPLVVTDRDAHGALWAAGPTWKASFSVAGATFVPCFGATAPRNFPASLARAVVRIGGELLATEPVPPVLAGDRAEYRGSGFTEQFVLREAGIEQQFVFAALPQRGGIDVTVPFATGLSVAAGADGFRIGNELGSYGYGRAVAIDGKGVRLELETEWTGGGFRIRVPARFVAAAALPLTIDPLVGNVVAYGNDTRVIATTDLAWDESLGRYALVHERVFSATDSDVYVRYLDSAMQFATPTLAIDLTTDSWRQPRIAGLEAHDTFLVVAQRSVGNVTPFSGIARRLVGAAPTLSAPFSVFTPNNNLHHLDVGGDPAPTGPTRFALVAEQEFSSVDHDIVAETRDANGNWVATVTIEASNDSEVAPQISKSCGFPGGGSEGWGIGFLRRLSPTLSQPVFACIDRNLVRTAFNITTTFTVPSLASAIAVSSPTDHAQGRHYALYVQYESGSYDYARGAVFARNGAQVAQTGVWGSSYDAVGEPQIDSDGTRFLLTKQAALGSGTNEVDFVLLGIEGNWLSSQQWDGGNTLADAAPCVVARRSGGGGDRGYGVAWVELLSATTSRVVASNYDGIQAGAQLAMRFTSCGGLGFLSGGDSALGGTVTMQLVQTQGLVGWLVGMPVDLPIGACPGCRQGAAGNAVFGPSYTFAVPRNAAFVGLTVSFQGFQFQPAGVSGACLGQVNLSNTLDATIR